MTPDPWTTVTGEVAEALLALPGDGLLDLLARDRCLTATWLLPDRVLLELSGASPRHGPALVGRGWRAGRRGAWHVPCDGADRADAARWAGAEAAGVLRDVLGLDAADVELWRPGVEVVPPAPRAPDQDALW